MKVALDRTRASRFARIALDNVALEYPNKLDHLMTSAADVASPRELHPVFYGSYDWHSSVHMHWTLVRLLALFPDRPEADAIVACLDTHFTVERIAGECAYLDRPGAASFERPYGWAWLLKLGEALHRSAVDDPRAVAWRDRLQPLVDRFVARTLAWLPRAAWPSRTGTHGNSAFALRLMLDYAVVADAIALREAIVAKSLAWFESDRHYPIGYETGSEDFLSNGLQEASLMRHVFRMGGNPSLGTARFHHWWNGFVPDVASLAPWFAPLVPGDRSDARLAHLDGLNLSRAWCWSELVDAMPDAIQPAVRGAIDAHRDASLPHAVEGHYVGTHWLASFALLALGA